VPATVCVRGGRIAEILSYDDKPEAATVEDLGEISLLPGLVDTHVHVNEPGRTEWEGFATATAAAAAGGVTTVIDMPLNSVPPTLCPAALEAKRSAASGQCHVDVGFWGGLVPHNVDQLLPLYDAGVFGFKAFLTDSGVEEFPPCTPVELEAGLQRLREVDALAIVHAEDAATLATAPAPGGRGYASFLESRPAASETAAVRRLIALSRALDARVHVLHVSAADAASTVGRARQAGVRVSAETCPHYLTFTAEEVADGATQFKCCPPIREGMNRELLWRALTDGSIQCIASDHSPSVPELKRLDTGDFAVAWGGISSLQVALPAVWTEARLRGHDLGDVVRWMGEAPAALVGLRHKGLIAPGHDADLVAFAHEEAFTVDPGALRHRHPITPYARRRLVGVVHQTWLRGIPVDAEPRGRLIRRGEA
jgi:allantoinase